MNTIKPNQGFTLAELMVVLVVLGVLSTMAIPRFLGATNKAKAVECKPILKEIYTLQSVYNVEHGVYASNIVELSYAPPSALAGARYDYDVIFTSRHVGKATVARKAIGPAAVGQAVCIDNTSAMGVSAIELGGLLNFPLDFMCF